MYSSLFHTSPLYAKFVCIPGSRRLRDIDPKDQVEQRWLETLGRQVSPAPPVRNFAPARVERAAGLAESEGAESLLAVVRQKPACRIPLSGNLGRR